MTRHGVDYVIDNQARNGQERNRQKRREEPGTQTENHHLRAGVPYDLEDRWNVPERGYAFLPSGPEIFPFRHSRLLWILKVSALAGRTESVGEHMEPGTVATYR